MRNALTKKRCKECGKDFYPLFSSFQKTCGTECAKVYGKKIVEKERSKQWTVEKKEWKDKLMTLSDWIQLCQITFNKYIRLRDKEKPCISSGRSLIGKYDAGHFYSCGSYPNLRFNEDNCHGQSVHDNRDKHGNLLAYREGLIARIGQERFDELERLKNVDRHYTIPEIKELIAEYKKKIKELQK
jgi:hypothetical protein